MSKENNNEPVLYAKIFFIFVFFAALISMSYKLFFLIQNSTFKHPSINILTMDKYVNLINIDTQDDKFSIKTLSPDLKKSLAKKSRVEQSAILGVFIDSSITSENQNIVNDSNDFMSGSTFTKLIFSPGNFHVYNLNEFDIVKAYIYTKVIKKSDSDDNNNLSMYSDSGIANEGLSLEIVNATNVDGLGTSVGDALKSVGYNVVSIKSSEEKKSMIMAKSKDSESVGRLVDSLRLPFGKEDSSAISDIVLILGPDILKNQ